MSGDATTTRKATQDSPEKTRFLSGGLRCLLLPLILLLQLALFLFFPSLHDPLLFGNVIPSETKSCESPGRVFVYELPPVFNKELVENCGELNPWGSRCAMLENAGFGKRGNFSREVVPERLAGAWFATDQFAAELIFHERMLSHPCRTKDPGLATAFYVPFYGGLAVGKFLWSHNSSGRDRDRLCEKLIEWLEMQELWRRKNGFDHFMMLGRITWDFRRGKAGGWGSRFLHMPAMKNVTRLLIERNPWDVMDLAVPYPTAFHPRSDVDVDNWRAVVSAANRRVLFSFAGAARAGYKKDFRGEILRQCEKAGDKCMSLDCRAVGKCGNDSSATIRLFLESEFCLQPRGDSYTRRSMFDCMVAGAIPVFFWRRTAYDQYTWHFPANDTSYSVFIDKSEVKNGTSIERVLAGIGEERIRQMREMILTILPRLVYAAPPYGLERTMDAFDVAVDGVLRAFRKHQPLATAFAGDGGY